MRDILQDGNVSVHTLLHYLSERKGGLLRPKIVLLTAGMCGGITEETYRAACMGELLHQASLIHDDVVDNASERRNRASVNAIWDNKIAVLLGDNLLSRVLQLLSASALPELLKEVTRTVRCLTEGEISQLAQRGNLEMETADYDRIVYLKTASLIETSFRWGAMSASASAERVEAFGAFGRAFGTAFQWRDDLKDFCGADGKGRYNDLREGEVTLPVLECMQGLCLAERADFRRLYGKAGKNEADLAALAATIVRSGGWQRSVARLKALGEELQQRCRAFAPSPYRDDLLRLTEELSAPLSFEPREG